MAGYAALPPREARQANAPYGSRFFQLSSPRA